MPKRPAEAAAAASAAYPLSCLFASGACCLVLEVVGTRLISPLYGSSVYTWSALITTTMVALAAGYAAGGRLAQRRDPRALFPDLLLAGGLLIAAIPLVREPVLRATLPLGVRLGALVASAVLVGPALAALGALGPVVTRWTATGADDAGRRAGDAWAVSTAGSVVGAALAGFVLVPAWPATRILQATAAVLVACGAWGRRGSPARAGAALAVLALLGAAGRPKPPHPDVRERVESLYGRIEVLDMDSTRMLLVNGVVQSAMDAGTGASTSDYVLALSRLPELRPGSRRVLALGLGAGLLPGALERAGLTVDAVEIDPAVVRTASRWFGYAPKGRVTIGDARAELAARRGPPYDLLVLDAFGAESPPAHLFTSEAFAAMKDAMAPGGVLALNVVSAPAGVDAGAWHATYKTLRARFPNVRAFAMGEPGEPLANVLLYASEGPLDRSALPEVELVPSPGELARVPEMTDDHAPLDSLLAGTALRWRGALQDSLSEVLLR